MMDEEPKKDLQSKESFDIIPTKDELRILQNLRNEAARRPYGHFGPVVFFTHGGELKYGIFKETDEIETRI